MNVLFLGAPDLQMIEAIKDCEITAIHSELKPDYPYDEPDFVISYGYHFIVKEPFLSRWAGKIINIHISFLPWNRGVSPNLWSWYEGTPKGVSIHKIDEGIDTGPLLTQREVWISDKNTLRTSYEILKLEAGRLFVEYWPHIKSDGLTSLPRFGEGSFHTMKQSKQLLSKFRNGYDTTCAYVAAIGKEDGRETGASVPPGGGGCVAPEEQGQAES